MVIFENHLRLPTLCIITGPLSSFRKKSSPCPLTRVIRRIMSLDPPDTSDDTCTMRTTVTVRYPGCQTQSESIYRLRAGPTTHAHRSRTAIRFSAESPSRPHARILPSCYGRSRPDRTITRFQNDGVVTRRFRRSPETTTNKAVYGESRIALRQMAGPPALGADERAPRSLVLNDV